MPNKKAKYRKMERRKKNLEIRKYKRMKKQQRRTLERKQNEKQKDKHSISNN